VQLAGRIAEAPQHQDRGHQVPADLLATFWHDLCEQPVQPQCSPQRQAKPDVAKIPRLLNAHILDVDSNLFRHRLVIRLRVKQRRVDDRSRFVVEFPCKLGPAPAVHHVQLAQVSQRAVARPLAHAF